MLAKIALSAPSRRW
jgi:magnesium-transporting ATPase (P-type)